MNPIETEIKALISLLSETDDRNLSLIKRRLIELHSDMLPFLIEALSHADLKIQKEAASLLENIRIDVLNRKWIVFCSEPNEVNLEEGAFLISTYAFPHLNSESYRLILNQWADDISQALKRDRSGKKKYQIVLNTFFQKLGFTGNRENYHDPDNSYLPAVMDRKTGLPITLSLLLVLIARRLNLPFYPVGMPGHFIVTYTGEGESLFIDPFNGGKLVTKEECIVFLTNSGYGYRENYLQVTGNRAILERMLRNLISVYSQQHQPDAVVVMTRLVEILHRP
ncbi:MAG: hypothetical protein HY200_00240 [Nitrospirae bacterium]|nr:hypothetical protein [Nitrospirota bacterium]MBI3593366.1 hypothetical protein [Nitrospirota bacterium]